MGHTTTRRMAVALGLLLVLAGASVAEAAKPVRSPYAPGPTVLGPGQACAFAVELAQVAGSNFTLTEFKDRLQITGSGHDRVTNLETGASVTLPTSGKGTISALPNGDQRVQASGRTVFYFFEGDQGPFGTVGPDGAVYYIVGRVDEILDPETGFTVTSFVWSGRATELCSRIS